MICYQAPIGIKVVEKKRMYFFSATPGPANGPQKNIGTLLCPIGSDKLEGSLRSNHSGLTTRAEANNGNAWDYIVRECNGLPTKKRV